MALWDAISGHLWTLAPVFHARLRPMPAPLGEPFEVTFTDARVGEVTLTGLLHRAHADAPLVVIVHGLGGSIGSPYMGRLARLAQAAGASTLLLNLRGADRRGDDIYHAGLVDDLSAALASAQLCDVRGIAVLGCSMGGHMVLRWALAPTDDRVRAVAALCSPLDLSQGCVDIDAPARAMYRDHVLTGLKQIYAMAHARGRVTTALERVLSVRTLRAWDELAVVPRFGFASVEHYWHETQMAPHLARLALPTRIVVARNDPMVLMRTSARYFERLPHHVQVLPVEGGHMGFPPASSAERELVRWLVEKARGA
jgi:predicted alpha/beta-fold hydrolase